jgi:hypothetical protein
LLSFRLVRAAERQYVEAVEDLYAGLAGALTALCLRLPNDATEAQAQAKRRRFRAIARVISNDIIVSNDIIEGLVGPFSQFLVHAFRGIGRSGPLDNASGNPDRRTAGRNGLRDERTSCDL